MMTSTNPHPNLEQSLAGPDSPILVTGANGFIGLRVVQNLVHRGFRNIRCFVRPSSDRRGLEAIVQSQEAGSGIQVITGNLLSIADCTRAALGVSVVYHLAAARGEKSFPDAFLNTVVTTRNLLEALRQNTCLSRFVSISSFSVYANEERLTDRLLDESCPIESHPERTSDAYSFAKIKQDQLVTEYGKKFNLPYVIVRPGVVYGSGNEKITGRVGIGAFGIFLHLGGSNMIPFTYVENCAEAIVLAGLKAGVDTEVFNVVDDNLPSSRRFLQLYKEKVRPFRSIYIPNQASYFLCWLWETYSNWSEGQLPPVYNRRLWNVYWKKTRYTNAKLKRKLGWCPKVSSSQALDYYFESCREKLQHA